MIEAKTIDEVSLEVAYARTKFPGNRYLFTALVEEVGELAQAILQQKPLSEIRMEARQIACVAIRIMEEGDPIYDMITPKEATP